MLCMMKEVVKVCLSDSWCHSSPLNSCLDLHMATDPVFALLEDAGGDNGLIVSTYTPPILYGITVVESL